MTTPLLTTKLYIPPVRPELVSRPRLIERLNAGQHRKLTLISAPAGFGKTTLLSEWVHQADVPVAWLSLAEEDNDPARFLTYAIAALQTIDRELGNTALAMLQSPQPTATESVLTVLINDLAEMAGSCALVLDDYHVIEAQPIDQALTFLLDHLPPPPSGMHLIIAGRTDPSLPLSRLRAGGQMTEIRVHDLRFTRDEAATFLTQTMGLNLSPENIAALETRAEGWIVGLQLAALSMQGEHPDHIARFIQTFTGSHRYVVDYLVEEVLKRRPPGTRSFLLETSILDRLTGSLCDAVRLPEGPARRERDEGAAKSLRRSEGAPISEGSAVTGPRDGQATLERLEEANLFLVPLDNERRWYRYHHLFAELLRNQLVASHPELVPTLHRRASMWFEDEGLLSEAITHSIAAKDWQLAARQILRTMTEMMGRGEDYTTLLRQLEALPGDIVRASPHLAIMYAYVLAIRIQLDAVEPRLQEIERTAGDQLTTELRLQIKDVRAHVAVLQNNGERAFELSREVLKALPEDRADDNPLQRQARMGMVFNLGHAYLFFEGNATKAQRWYAETLALCRTAGSTTLSLRAMMGLAQAQQLRGQLNQANETCRQGLQLAKTTEQRYGRVLPAVAWIQLVLGDLLREWNKLDEAADYLAQCIELSRLWQVGDILCAGYLFQARLRQAQGDIAGALDSIRQAEQLPQAYRDVPWTGGPIPACRAQLALAQARSIPRLPERENAFDSGALGTVERWVEESGLSLDGSVSNLNEEFAYLIWVRLLIAQKQGDRALKLLARLHQAAEDGDRTGRVIEVLALQALAQQALGDSEQALVALQQALSLAEPEGYTRLFVDEGVPMDALLRDVASRGVSPTYVGKLLEAFESEARDQRPLGETKAEASTSVVRSPSPGLRETEGLFEPLSTRELEVLQLIGAGLTNREIALELAIAVSTVKTHLKNIYAKLGARNRTQAVARARELNLVP